LKKYKFELSESTIPEFIELDHIILANSLENAIEKFSRKHQLEPPAYWDEPFFDTHIDLIFTNKRGKIVYSVSWS